MTQFDNFLYCQNRVGRSPDTPHLKVLFVAAFSYIRHETFSSYMTHMCQAGSDKCPKGKVSTLKY